MLENLISQALIDIRKILGSTPQGPERTDLTHHIVNHCGTHTGQPVDLIDGQDNRTAPRVYHPPDLTEEKLGIEGFCTLIKAGEIEDVVIIDAKGEIDHRIGRYKTQVSLYNGPGLTLDPGSIRPAGPHDIQKIIIGRRNHDRRMQERRDLRSGYTLDVNGKGNIPRINEGITIKKEGIRDPISNPNNTKRKMQIRIIGLK
uniref:Uncharacterized protein n=2 Tax=Thermoplasma acidophilum TaxID=2303 RepID=Q0KKZ2_THEAI|nr:hypothetical protein [Cloning vector pSTA]BAF30818.1 hypothetical protein [Thermoplasma acidophilum]